MKALEAIVDIQNEKITRMQAQFDMALAQMVQVVGAGGEDEVTEIITEDRELDISKIK